MTERNNLRDLKTIAKRIARLKRIPHSEALNLVALEIGFPHWHAVSSATKNGWHPSSEQIAAAEDLLKQVNPDGPLLSRASDAISLMFSSQGNEEDGYIGPHPYRTEVWLDDVIMSGRGWRIHVGEAPSSDPKLEITDRRFKNNPINDPEFVSLALEIANARAEQVRARIAADWPRRSTKPDAQGRALHPLHGELSDAWYCLHCDTKSAAKAVASNMWHCPSCSASPIDIFSTPFWLGDNPNKLRSSG